MVAVSHSSRPSLNDLVTHVTPLVNKKWFDLGLELLDKKYDYKLKNIEADIPNNTEQCCRETFSRWLDIDELASWNKLIKALRIISLNTAASDIEKLLQEGEYVHMLLTCYLNKFFN